MDWKLRDAIVARDGGCVARFAGNRLWATTYPMLYRLEWPGPCRMASGRIISPYDRRYLTIDEVKMDAPGEPGSHLRMAKKAGYSMETCIAVCAGHHVFGKQWSTSTEAREAIREYIVVANSRRVKR